MKLRRLFYFLNGPGCFSSSLKVIRVYTLEKQCSCTATHLWECCIVQQTELWKWSLEKWVLMSRAFSLSFLSFSEQKVIWTEGRPQLPGQKYLARDRTIHSDILLKLLRTSMPTCLNSVFTWAQSEASLVALIVHTGQQGVINANAWCQSSC